MKYEEFKALCAIVSASLDDTTKNEWWCTARGGFESLMGEAESVLFPEKTATERELYEKLHAKYGGTR